MIESLEERVRALTEQLESQYELHKNSAQRARKAEEEIAGLQDRLRSAEGELAAGDVLRDGFKTDKEKVNVDTCSGILLTTMNHYLTNIYNFT